MKKRVQKENFIKYLAVLSALVLTGCGTIGLAQEATFESAYENSQEEEVDIYTANSLGVLKSVNEEEGWFQIYRINEADELTLNYSGATTVYDSYGAPLVMGQLPCGEIVEVAYNEELQKAGNIQASSDTFTRQGISKYELDPGRGTLIVGEDTYKISGDTKAFSGREEIALDQILKEDTITIKGMEHQVSSILIDQGHGYLKLNHSENLIGGWIEIGQTVIQQISQDMLLTVPEGEYRVRITMDGGIEEVRDISIVRSEETVLDLSEIEIPEPVSGRVVFGIHPSTALVYVDGIPVNTAYAIRLPFGLHQITASLDGYDTVSEYFDVQGETTKVNLSLGEAKEETTTVSGNSMKNEESYHTVTIEKPEDVEVYQDNLYMGLSPVTFEKKVGTHTMTLRKDGYLTVSYQIEVTDDDRDLVYSFADLVEGRDNTVSGNELSTNNKQNNESVSGNEQTVSGNGNLVSGNSLETPKTQ